MCRVWRTKDGRMLRTINAHCSGVRALAAALAGDRLYSCSSDNTIQVCCSTTICDTENKECESHIPAHRIRSSLQYLVSVSVEMTDIV